MKKEILKITPILIFFSSVLISLALYVTGAFDNYQDRVIDRLFVKGDPSKDIIIVAIDNESIRSIGQWPWPRAVFGKAINQLSKASSISIDVNFAEPSRLGKSDDEYLARSFSSYEGIVVLPVQYIEKTKTIQEPLDLFKNHVRTGLINIKIDADGIVRTVPRMHLGNSLFATAHNARSDNLDGERIVFYGPEGTFTTLPFIDVLEGLIPERVIEGRTVYIGATAEDLQDFVQTPFGRIPGVELHATISHMQNTGERLIDISLLLGILLILLKISLVAILVFSTKRFLFLILSILIIFLLSNGLSIIAFGFNYVIPILYLNIALIISGGLSLTYKYFLVSRERKIIEQTFKHYLSPEVVKDLVENPEKVKLGGEERIVTIQFSDIRGFTALSEALTPMELIDRLNTYLSHMTDAILEYRGLLDKYIGDAIMAIWGAPLSGNHAEEACYAVLKQLRELERLNNKWAKENIRPIEIGIGLHTGVAIVGNMGSEKRFDYSVIGDSVNFAARLESLTKIYKTQCLISEDTFNLVSKNYDFNFRALDLVVVKGKNKPKRIYEFLTKKLDDFVSVNFAKGLRAYEKGHWQEAILFFERILRKSDDHISKIFLERSKHYSEIQPDDWRGIHKFTTK